MADEDSSLLLKLPAELRIRIYEYAIVLPRDPSGRYVVTDASSNLMMGVALTLAVLLTAPNRLYRLSLKSIGKSLRGHTNTV